MATSSNDDDAHYNNNKKKQHNHIIASQCSKSNKNDCGSNNWLVELRPLQQPVTPNTTTKTMTTSPVNTKQCL